MKILFVQGQASRCVQRYPRLSNHGQHWLRYDWNDRYATAKLRLITRASLAYRLIRFIACALQLIANLRYKERVMKLHTLSTSTGMRYQSIRCAEG